eukprot:257642-Amphidinium_carterae.1
MFETRTHFGKLADAACADPLVWGDFRDALDILVKSDTPYADPRVYEDLGWPWFGCHTYPVPRIHIRLDKITASPKEGFQYSPKKTLYTSN